MKFLKICIRDLCSVNRRVRITGVRITDILLYLFPCLVVLKGPVISMAIRSKGSPVKVPVNGALSRENLFFSLLHSSHEFITHVVLSSILGQ